MKKLIISLSLALLLVAALAVPAVASTEDITASVTVAEYSSVTIVDNGDAGLAFGSLDPGTEKQAEAASPSVTVTAAAENNVAVDIELSGTNFSDGGTNSFAIGNAFWNDEDNSGTATAMSTTATTVETLSAGQSVSIYHWLSIPTGQAAATYSSTFTYSSD